MLTPSIRKYATTLALGAALAQAGAPSTAQAKTTCEGKVTRIGVDGSGYVHASVQGAGVDLVYARFCSLSGTYGLENITKEACQGMLSVLQMAFLSKSGVTVYFQKNIAAADKNLCTVSWADVATSNHQFYFLGIWPN